MRTVEHFMTPSPIAVLTDCTIAEAREFMRRAAVHHLPVLAGRKLVGLVDEGDLSALEDLSEMERHRAAGRSRRSSDDSGDGACAHDSEGTDGDRHLGID